MRELAEQVGDLEGFAPEHFAAREQQHVLDQALEVLEPADGFLRDADAACFRQIGVFEITGIEQRGGQRRAQLMGELRGHFAHRRQALVALGFLAQALRLGIRGGQLGRQRLDLPFQRAIGRRQLLRNLIEQAESLGETRGIQRDFGGGG